MRKSGQPILAGTGLRHEFAYWKFLKAKIELMPSRPRRSFSRVASLAGLGLAKQVRQQRVSLWRGVNQRPVNPES
jgi:hypothetical protein